MKSATEFGVRAESYSRTRRGPNSNNVFFALLVPSARSLPFFSRCFTSGLQGRAREREAKRKVKEKEKEREFHVSSIHGYVQYLAATRFIRENRSGVERGVEFELKQEEKCE